MAKSPGCLKPACGVDGKFCPDCYDTESLFEALRLKEKVIKAKNEKIRGLQEGIEQRRKTIDRLNKTIDGQMRAMASLDKDLLETKKLLAAQAFPATAQAVKETVLEEAARITSADRQKSYGHPLHNHTATGEMFSIYYSRRYGLDIPFDAEDVCFFHIVGKVSRWANDQARDNVTDIAGYARNVEMCAEERERLKAIGPLAIEPQTQGVATELIEEFLDAYPSVPRNEAGTPQLEEGS